MKKYFGDSVNIETDCKYYRVVIRLGTHKFHSEKLNIETAAKLHYQLLTGEEA
jgi:hypothetical protein